MRTTRLDIGYLPMWPRLRSRVVSAATWRPVTLQVYNGIKIAIMLHGHIWTLGR